jgi:hypothetical protein
MNDGGSGRKWFKAKTYGYGWTPATWQGWFVMALYLLGVFVAASGIIQGEDLGADGVKRFLVTVFLLTLLLLSVAYEKGDPLRWRWGKEEKHEKDV